MEKFSVSQIRVENAKELLEYYSKNFKFEVVRRYVAKKYKTSKHLVNKLVYAQILVNQAEIILTEWYDKNLPENKNVYLVFERTKYNQKWIENFFNQIKNLKNIKIWVFPVWNKTQTLYGSFVDKFGVHWEFKIR